MKAAIALSTVLLAAPLYASCPTWMDHSLRKLHSADNVNLCDIAANKPLLIVNTASHCGFTPQFKELEALHKKYSKSGLVVVGFASNDFRQEAKNEEKAAEVCYVNYGVTFTMFAPSHVRGEQSNPVFRELAAQSQAPDWNFNKYLVDRDGIVVQHFGSQIRPDAPRFRRSIETLRF